jgi:hypothetical protein
MVAPLTDQGTYLKAALVLAEMSAEDLASVVEADIHIGKRTLERVTAGERTLKPWERDRIAAALNVPPWFLERGLLADDPRPGDSIT